MACSVDFVEFVCRQVALAGTVRYRKMFGDYVVYVNEKAVMLLCDDLVYVKKHEAVAELLGDAETGFPYQGAKEHYLLDVSDKDLSLKVVSILADVLPYPKSKKKVKKGEAMP